MDDDDIDRALNTAANQALMTACERYEARRAALEQLGHRQSEMLWNAVKNELHQEAIDAGNPCPCGLKPVSFVSKLN